MRIKSMKYICFIIVSFMLTVISCNSTQIEGRVLEKSYEQAETYYGIVPIYVIPDNESNSIQYKGETPILAWIPMALEDDEDYLITVETLNRAYPKVIINVSREVYEKTMVGETLKFTNYESYVLESDTTMRMATSEEMVQNEFTGSFPYVRQR